MSAAREHLNGDLSARAVAETGRMTWAGSPGAGVLRKRLHLVGDAESGQVTSVVRYEPGASFPAHGHPEGEEILVLEGTFSDEHGDWPVGTHLLNPEGFHHAPFSHEGCTLFVKLRQYAGAGRAHHVTDTRGAPWRGLGRTGVESQVLYDTPEFPDRTVIERWVAGAAPGHEALPGGIEIFVLEGALEDAHGCYTAGTWIRVPVGGGIDARSPSGCTVYAKRGGVGALRTAV